MDDKKTNAGENKPEVKAPEISSPEKESPVDRIRHLTQKQMAALGCGLYGSGCGGVWRKQKHHLERPGPPAPHKPRPLGRGAGRGAEKQG